MSFSNSFDLFIKFGVSALITRRTNFYATYFSYGLETLIV